MARSFRVDPNLEARLREVAARENLPVSAVVREAIAKHCDEVLGQNTKDQLADVIGVIHSEGGRADRTGEAFTAALIERSRR
jgi:predicted transcriptional regulator